jgi:hypothetical protein
MKNLLLAIATIACLGSTALAEGFKLRGVDESDIMTFSSHVTSTFQGKYDIDIAVVARYKDRNYLVRTIKAQKASRKKVSKEGEKYTAMAVIDLSIKELNTAVNELMEQIETEYPQDRNRLTIHLMLNQSYSTARDGNDYRRHPEFYSISALEQSISSRVREMPRSFVWHFVDKFQTHTDVSDKKSDMTVAYDLYINRSSI